MLIYLLRPRTIRHSGTFTHKKRVNEFDWHARGSRQSSWPFKWALMMMTVVRQRTTMNTHYFIGAFFSFTRTEMRMTVERMKIALLLFCFVEHAHGWQRRRRWWWWERPEPSDSRTLTVWHTQRAQDDDSLSPYFFCQSHSVEFRV